MDNAQQVLPVFLFNDDAYFESFYITESSRLLVNSLQQLVQNVAEDFVFISASQGLGKSHLLQAVCHLASECEQSHLYLPLQQVKDFSAADVLAGHEHIRVLCLDDLHSVCGDADWEEVLFNVYNQRLQLGLPLYLSADAPAALLSIELADLQSRLSAMLSFQVSEVSDEEKSQLLKFRAAQRGIDLNDACLSYIIQRCSRDVSELIQLLQKLDKDSLAQGRKITVPFIKAVLSGS